MSVLTDKINDFLKSNNLTVAEAERKAGVKPNSIHNILKGRIKAPHRKNLLLLSEMLSCDPQNLISISKRSKKRILSAQEKENLCASVAYLLDKLSISPPRLALLCGFSPSSLSKILSPKIVETNPSRKVLSGLAALVSCAEEDLLMARTDKFKLPRIEDDEADDISPLRTAISTYLEQNKISIPTLERKARIETNALRAILQGASKRPMADTVAAIANTLGVTVENLLEGKLEQKQNTTNSSSIILLTQPELLRETLAVILEIAKEKKVSFTLHQICGMLSEAYLYAVKTDPIAVQKPFIEWVVEKVRAEK